MLLTKSYISNKKKSQTLKEPRSKMAANNIRNSKTFNKRITVKLVTTAGPTGIAMPDQ